MVATETETGGQVILRSLPPVSYQFRLDGQFETLNLFLWEVDAQTRQVALTPCSHAGNGEAYSAIYQG